MDTVAITTDDLGVGDNAVVHATGNERKRDDLGFGNKQLHVALLLGCPIPNQNTLERYILSY